jgi:type IV pilus assembly protein PilA
MHCRSTLIPRRSGFTLIELLLVIGIIAILASIVIVAINPTKQLGDARNAQRRSDVNTILNAVYQYYVDTNSLPTGITTTAKGICMTGAASCANGVDLSVLTTNGRYLVRIPYDPQAVTTGTGSLYTIAVDAGNRLTVAAPNAEQGNTIAVTR